MPFLVELDGKYYRRAAGKRPQDDNQAASHVCAAACCPENDVKVLPVEEGGARQVSAAGKRNRFVRASAFEPFVGSGIARELGTCLGEKVAKSYARARNATLHCANIES